MSSNTMTVCLCDETGRPLGDIVAPAGQPLWGPGAATVLLTREYPPLRPARSSPDTRS